VQYYFKYSSNYYFHPGDNKQTYYALSGSGTNFLVSAEGQSSPKMRMVFQRTGSDGGAGSRYSNTGYNPTILVDTWYKVTIHVILNTTDTATGTFQMWLNDTLLMSHSNIKFLTGTDIGKKFGTMEYTPVFGGGSDQVKPATDYFWVDFTQIQTTSFGSGGIDVSAPYIPVTPSTGSPSPAKSATGVSKSNRTIQFQLRDN